MIFRSAVYLVPKCILFFYPKICAHTRENFTMSLSADTAGTTVRNQMFHFQLDFEELFMCTQTSKTCVDANKRVHLRPDDNRLKQIIRRFALDFNLIKQSSPLTHGFAFDLMPKDFVLIGAEKCRWVFRPCVIRCITFWFLCIKLRII